MRIASLRLVWASTKQLVRSREAMATMLIYPAAVLMLLALFSNLRLETSESTASLMDFWLTGFGVLMVALGNGHAFLATIATYKSTGMLKRISVTPISPAHLILAEVIPRALMGMVVIVAFLAAGKALGADVRISAAALGVVPIVLMVSVTGLSIAFVIAGRTRTPQDANAVDSYASFPLYLFTGAMFPLAAFPGWLERVAQFIPYTGLIAAVRGMIHQGRAITEFGSELTIGGAWLLLAFVGAVRSYRFIK